MFDNWPEEWKEEAVSKAEILRLIYQVGGKTMSSWYCKMVMLKTMLNTMSVIDAEYSDSGH